MRNRKSRYHRPTCKRPSAAARIVARARPSKTDRFRFLRTVGNDTRTCRACSLASIIIAGPRVHEPIDTVFGRLRKRSLVAPTRISNTVLRTTTVVSTHTARRYSTLACYVSTCARISVLSAGRFARYFYLLCGFISRDTDSATTCCEWYGKYYGPYYLLNVAFARVVRSSVWTNNARWTPCIAAACVWNEFGKVVLFTRTAASPRTPFGHFLSIIGHGRFSSFSTCRREHGPVHSTLYGRATLRGVQWAKRVISPIFRHVYKVAYYCVVSTENT